MSWFVRRFVRRFVRKFARKSLAFVVVFVMAFCCLCLAGCGSSSSSSESASEALSVYDYLGDFDYETSTVALVYEPVEDEEEYGIQYRKVNDIDGVINGNLPVLLRSEEHTSELQSP